MQTYGEILNIVMPIFLLLFFIEKIAEWRMGASVIRGLDSVSSISSGITNVVKDVLQLSVGIISYGWMVKNLAIVHIEETWLLYVIGFMVVDFQGYWSHRWNHEINFFWNQHIIHHSSEEYNLACALRQSISGFIGFFTFLLLPAALLGVPGKVIAVIGPLHLFLQYWYHTRLIGKMGWLEKIIVTPSHHRVHHAMNPEYMDKNYSQIFIFWDKWFGTFQEELPDVPPVYGIKRPARTWNPVKINFQHLWLLIQDAWRARSWWDKIRIWAMPTGWRPADVAEKYPVYAVSDVYHFEKYNPVESRSLTVWSWVQLLASYFLLIYYFAYFGEIGSPGVFWYGAYFFIAIYAFTELMDANRNALWMEAAKSLFGFWLLWQSGGDWFGSDGRVGEWVKWLVGFYLFASPLVVAWFVNSFGKTLPSVAPAGGISAN